MVFKNITKEKNLNLQSYHVVSGDLSMMVMAESAEEAVITAFILTKVDNLSHTVICKNKDSEDIKPEVFITTEILYAMGFEKVIDY